MGGATGKVYGSRTRTQETRIALWQLFPAGICQGAVGEFSGRWGIVLSTRRMESEYNKISQAGRGEAIKQTSLFSRSYSMQIHHPGINDISHH